MKIALIKAVAALPKTTQDNLVGMAQQAIEDEDFEPATLTLDDQSFMWSIGTYETVTEDGEPTDPETETRLLLIMFADEDDEIHRHRR
jgi:hypothetical protein